MSSTSPNNRKRGANIMSNIKDPIEMTSLDSHKAKKLKTSNVTKNLSKNMDSNYPNNPDQEDESPIDDSLQSFHRQRNNRYCESSPAPFIVFVFDSNPENNLGNIHITSIGMKIYNAGFKISALKREGTKRFSLAFQTFEEANSFIVTGVKKINSSWRAYVPDVGIYSAGLIIDVPPEISIEKLRIGLECLDSESIQKIERIQK